MAQIKKIKWLITGSGGQLATEMSLILKKTDVDFVSLSHKELDIRDYEAVKNVIDQLKPEVILNAAAWTNVDLAEDYSKEAYEINANGALNLAKTAKINDIKLIQISTDYVFSGEPIKKWETTDVRNPVNVYGKTKSIAEDLILSEHADKTVILRTAWLYSPWRTNFVKKIIFKAITDNEEIEVVTDQYGQPTSAHSLANRILELNQNKIESGIFHATNSGITNWFQFAQKIFNLIGADLTRLKPINSSSLNQKAVRPKYTELSHDSWNKYKISSMLNWEDELSLQFQTIFEQVRKEISQNEIYKT